MFGGVPVGVRDDYELNTGDFVLPPEYQSTEALYSSNPAAFGQTGLTTGGYIPSIRITPALFLGLSIDGVAQDGRDRLLGGQGNDVLQGGTQEDELDGGTDADYLDAGAGNDTSVLGGDGDDVVRGGAGDDTLRGGNGIDYLYGDDGTDNLFGEAGSSTGVQAGQRLFGGAGAIPCTRLRPQWLHCPPLPVRPHWLAINCLVGMMAIPLRQRAPRSSGWWRWQ